VSDTLIAGLWALDLMFVTAENGGGGVNFHGGETGMDGTNPFYYEPIMEKDGAVVQVQPVYYGMLFFVPRRNGSDGLHDRHHHQSRLSPRTPSRRTGS
jgi:hypothetical protein